MTKKFCLTKAEIADSIFSIMPVEKTQAEEILENFLEIIKQGLEQEGKVMISGFGSFEVKEKNARRGRNPHTGESIILRSRKVVKFKPSPILRKQVNREELDGFEEQNDADFF